MSEVELLKRIEKLEKWIERRSSKDQIPSSLVDGWIPDPTPWVYANSYQFTIVGKDRTSTFKPGVTKIKYNDGSVDYGIVASSSYSGGNTTVNLAPNGDYVMANVTLTGCYYSFGTPADFPASFSFTPAFTGLTTTGSPVYYGQLQTIGHQVFVYVYIWGNGGTTSSAGGISTYINNLPFTVRSAAPTGGSYWVKGDNTNVGPGLIYQNQARIYLPAWAAWSTDIFGWGNYLIG